MAARARVQTAVNLKDLEASSPEEKRLLSLSKLAPADFKSDEFLSLVKTEGIRVDSTDAHGATPLIHAAYKGNAEACGVLLAHGADVNWYQHSDKYTPLMFSMLSGSPSTTKVLLDAGADKGAVNNSGRNAFQIAVSIGQYGCIAIIKNHLPPQDVERFSSDNDSHPGPTIPANLVKPVHQLITTTSIHPVKLIQELQAQQELLENHKQFCAVLEHLLDEQFDDDHSFLALKLHYLSYLTRSCTAAQNGDQTLLKRLLQAKEPSGVYCETDGFLRQCLREYKNAKRCPVAIQMIQTLSSIPIGDDTSTFSVFHNLIISRRR